MFAITSRGRVHKERAPDVSGDDEDVIAEKR